MDEERFTMNRCDIHRDHFYIYRDGLKYAISFFSAELADKIDEARVLPVKQLKHTKVD